MRLMLGVHVLPRELCDPTVERYLDENGTERMILRAPDARVSDESVGPGRAPVKAGRGRPFAPPARPGCQPTSATATSNGSSSLVIHGATCALVVDTTSMFQRTRP